MSHNKISKIAHLENCISLRELNLVNNEVTSLLNINTVLGNIAVLILTGNRISDPSPLSRLYGLRILDLSYNIISDFCHFSDFHKLPELDQLWLKRNPIAQNSNY